MNGNPIWIYKYPINGNARYQFEAKTILSKTVIIVATSYPHSYGRLLVDTSTGVPNPSVGDYYK